MTARCSWLLAGVLCLVGACSAFAQAPASAGASPVVGLPGDPACPGCPDPGCPAEVEDDHAPHTPPPRCGTPAVIPFWATGEYLLWRVDRSFAPPLITTGPPASLGIPGMGGSTIVGGGTFGPSMFDGGRFRAGVHNDCGYGLEAGGFFLAQETHLAAGSSDPTGSPVLARPFLDASNPANLVPGVRLIAVPGLFAGSFQATSETEVWGFDVNVSFPICNDLGLYSVLRSEGLAGYRYLDLTERLNISDRSTPLPGPPGAPFNGGVGSFGGNVVLPGQTTVTRDDLLAHTQFQGAQIGFRVIAEYSNFLFQVEGKAAAGVSHEVATVSGASTLVGPGGTQTTLPGGVIVPNGSRRSTHDEFAVLPEGNVYLGYDLNGQVSIFAGYNFLYLSRAGRFTTGLPLADPRGQPTSPIFGGLTRVGGGAPLVPSDFFAHGASIGLAYRY
jgi:hypothetical protein